jgi:hypothetical protein
VTLILKKNNDKLMNKISAISLIIFLSLCTVPESYAGQKQKRKVTAASKTESIQLTNASSLDTSQYSIQVNGKENSVKINNEPVQSTTGKTGKQNTILVNGEGNTVSVSQDNNNSKVNISQNGNNNQISIMQPKQ